MKHTSWRRLRRYRRTPVPASPTRAQMRQRVARLLYVCQVEATLEAQLDQPDLQRLENLNHHVGFLNEALTILEDEHE